MHLSDSFQSFISSHLVLAQKHTLPHEHSQKSSVTVMVYQLASEDLISCP